MTRWSSHKEIAAKALKKLVGPHVPTTLARLEQAVKRAHAAGDEQSAERRPTEPDDGAGDEPDEDLDETA